MASCSGGVAVSLTLERAIRDKYSIREDEDEAVQHIQEYHEYALCCKPGTNPIERRTSIVLDCQGISQVGEGKELSELCPKVEELHLVTNCITQWKDITKILCSMPRLNFLNIGQNPLNSSTFIPDGLSHDQLSTLVLNGTGIDLVAVEACLKTVPQLEELHISMNNYCDVHFTPSFNHPKLRQLHINSNKISTWAEFRNISRAFPNLETLVASENPIEDVSVINLNDFPKLHALHLNESSLSSWKSIECLNALCKLKELSILKIPLVGNMKVNERRCAFIARLPRIQKLNKSIVTDDEREAAEKWLIRKFKDRPDPPSIYQDLVAKYGPINPLAEVNMKRPPPNTQLQHDDSKDKREEEEEEVEEEVKEKHEDIEDHDEINTLEQAIKDKYGRQMTMNHAVCPAHRRTSILLERARVGRVNDVKTLSKLCPMVEELFLSSNSITDWKDIIKILCSMPKLHFLNLSQNPLNSSTFIPDGLSHDHLSTLILNGTCIDLVAVEACLKTMPQLQELHISMNNYCDIHFTPSFNHQKLRQLHINNNRITTWAGLRNISHAFPNLETLVASENPIKDISAINSEDFPKLRALHLNKCSLPSWKSIECLNALCKLRELSVLKIPLGRKMEIEERRCAFIARLPRIQKLNKSVVTDSERIEAGIVPGVPGASVVADPPGANVVADPPGVPGANPPGVPVVNVSGANVVADPPGASDPPGVPVVNVPGANVVADPPGVPGANVVADPPGVPVVNVPGANVVADPPGVPGANVVADPPGVPGANVVPGDPQTPVIY